MQRCLIVDDEEDHRFIAKKAIQHLGVDINEACDGREALNLCKETMPDIIVLDMMMPDTDGKQFMEQLRKLEGGEKPKVIVCTATSDLDELYETMLNDVFSYLSKPFCSSNLETKVAEAMRYIR